MIKQDGTVLQQTSTGWQSDTTLQINTIAELLSQADQITLVDPPIKVPKDMKEMYDIAISVKKGRKKILDRLLPEKYFGLIEARKWNAENDLKFLENADGSINKNVEEDVLLGVVKNYFGYFIHLRMIFNVKSPNTDTSYSEIEEVIKTMSDDQRDCLIIYLHSALTILESSGDVITRDNFIKSLDKIFFGRQGGVDLRPGNPDSNFDFVYGNRVKEIKSASITNIDPYTYDQFLDKLADKLWDYCRNSDNSMEKKIERNPWSQYPDMNLELVIIFSGDATGFQAMLLKEDVLKLLREDGNLYLNEEISLLFDIRFISYDGKNTFLITKEEVNE